MSAAQQPDLCLTAAAAYEPYTIGHNNAGTFTATDAVTKATLICLNKVASGKKVTCVPIGEGLIHRMQFATAAAAFATLYQAAAGKVGTSSAGGALAIGQNGADAITKGASSSTHGYVHVTR